MAVIRVEWIPIKNWNLGLFGFDHMQVVLDHQMPRGKQDDWFVIEGTKGETFVLGVLGKHGVTTLSAANEGAKGFALVQKIRTPFLRGSRALPLDGLTSWRTMASYAQQIDGQFYYSALGIPGTVRPTSNSSSVIASLLYSVGLDLVNYMPYGIRISPGANTWLGTRGADEMTATRIYSTLQSGHGKDTLNGSDGNDKLYGGAQNDVLKVSRGNDIIHGGQFGMSYAKDGHADVVDLSGSGVIDLTGMDEIENVVPGMIAKSQLGTAQIFSMEVVRWHDATDMFRLHGNIQLLERQLLLDHSSSEGGRGGQVSLAGIDSGVVIAPTGDSAQVFARPREAADPGEGTWLRSVEWLTATPSDDEIYLSGPLLVVDGEGGDDLIDTRRIVGFSGASPQGYDAEVEGGDGNDTLIAGSGRTLLAGGEGSDRFIVGDRTGEAGRVEIVIEDAEATDRLLVPYNFFNGSGGGFEGSALLPVMGGFGAIQETGPDRFARFEALHQEDYWYGTDYTYGVIKFIGGIWFNLEGSDLLIHIFEGKATEETVDIDDAGTTRTYVYNDLISSLETLVRVKNYASGDLGLQFHELGEGTVVDLGDGTAGLSYANFNSSVDQMTNGGTLLDAVVAEVETAEAWQPDGDDAEPPAVEGTDSDDVIATGKEQGPVVVIAGLGHDMVTTGDAADVLDGGEGDDALAGGAGDDIYYVDSTADVVIELSGGGNDRIYGSIDIVAPDNVEQVHLVGAARTVYGNAEANTLAGNDLDNLLFGDAGDDRLAGSLGNDFLSGGEGGDTYFYTLGDGTDTIADEGDADGFDRIVFSAGINSFDVAVWRLEERPGDLLLILPEGGRIVIEDYLLETGGIEQVRFGDGETWSGQQLLSVAAAAPLRHNEAPTAVDDLQYVVMNPRLTIPSVALTDNDSDFEGDDLRLLAVESVEVATVALDDDGNVVFEVPEDFEGIASFNYTITDDIGGAASARVEIFVMREAAAGEDMQGTSGADALDGAAGNDTLSGLAGNDVLSGLEGDDELDGGEGMDRLLGGPGDDRLVGGIGQDRLDGGEGDDVLDGRSDELRATRDTLAGGAGDDTYLVYGDTIVERPGEGYDTAIAYATLRLRSNQAIEALVAAGPSIRVLAGNALDQALMLADDAEAVLLGGGGNDTIVGNAGANRLVGGSGDDGIDGLAGSDRLSGESGADRLDGGEGDDILRGGSGDDHLLGGAGGDLLRGGAGNDWLDGGEGDDTLFGDAGADRFVFAGNFGDDRIRGWQKADVIDLTAFSIGYGDLVFTRVTAGMEITSIAFGDGNSIILSGMTKAAGEASFRF